MRMLKLLLAAPFVLLAGCDTDPLAPHQGLIREADVVAPVVRNVKLVSEGTGEPIGWCAPGVVRNSITGSGIGTGSGRFTVAQTACLNLTTGAVTEGVATLVAANGDEIYFTWTGQARATPPGTFDMIYVVTGGTGRYLNAQGVLDVVVEHPTSTTFTAIGSGWMSLYPSDRANN